MQKVGSNDIIQTCAAHVGLLSPQAHQPDKDFGQPSQGHVTRLGVNTLKQQPKGQTISSSLDATCFSAAGIVEIVGGLAQFH